MRIKPLFRPGRRLSPGVRRKAWVFAGLMAGALVPLVVVQSQAAAYNVFCVGSSWASPEDGKTMEAVNFPSVVLSGIRSSWPGGLPGSDKESYAGNLTDGDKVVYRYQPDKTKKFTCAGSSAAPCVIQDALTITYESWKSENWHVSTTITNGYSAGGAGGYTGSVAVTAGYGQEWGHRDTKSTTVTNMVPYKLGDTIEPAAFIEWRVRTGEAVGGYFNTGATCRTDGEYGEQYEWRDQPTGVTFSFENNIGEGTEWLLETAPLERTVDYKGQ